MTKETTYASRKPIGDATVLRNWIGAGSLDNGKGVALKFNNDLSDSDTERVLVSGIQQKARLAAQAKIATIDIAYLGDYRRDLIECQTKLFVLNLTLGVALAGSYFALAYHSVAADLLKNVDLSFWRAMVATLPGILAIACGMMVAQKAISVQKIDAYLLLLKEYTIIGQFPREYMGWESSIRRLRYALGTDVCKTCEGVRNCGNLTIEEQKQLSSRRLLRKPYVDLYHIVTYMSFFVAFGLSLSALLVEFLKFEWRSPVYMVIGGGVTLTIAAGVVGLMYVFYHLRKGHFSVEFYKRCWIDLLNKCRWQT